MTPEVEGPLVTADRFTYDGAGRMITRDVEGVETGLTWDASSNLVATSGQGGDRVYLYDASGQRVAQLSVGDVGTPTPVAATVYFGATEATDADTATAGNVSATRFYGIGGATVATATAVTGGSVPWALLFGDVQGSASVSMELVADTGVSSGFEPASITHEVVRDAYMPYGAARGDASDDLAIDRGWLGQYEDAGTGLTYLNARYYDPMLGRFLSPDPLMDPGDPRTLDPYRYADNNPVSYTDATGLRPDCSGLSGDSKKLCMTPPTGKGGQTPSTSDGRKPTGGSKGGGKGSGGGGGNVAIAPPVPGVPPPGWSADEDHLTFRGGDGTIVSIPLNPSNLQKVAEEAILQFSILAGKSLNDDWQIFSANTGRMIWRSIPIVGAGAAYAFGSISGYEQYDYLPYPLRMPAAQVRGIAAGVGSFYGNSAGIALIAPASAALPPLAPVFGVALPFAGSSLGAWAGEESVDFVVENSWQVVDFAIETLPREVSEMVSHQDAPYVGCGDRPMAPVSGVCVG